jgi:acylphosphatase
VVETERFLVSGRVQGVGYRAFVRRIAEPLGITGQVRNLPDGRVEVIARGSLAARDALAAALTEGPLLAHVLGVERAPCEAAEAGRFTVE